jgi:hypothetical protein
MAQKKIEKVIKMKVFQLNVFSWKLINGLNKMEKRIFPVGKIQEIELFFRC